MELFLFLLLAGVGLFLICSAFLFEFNSIRKHRKALAKATLSRAFLSILSEADEVILLDRSLTVVYAKHLPEILGKTFDFIQIIQDQFVDHNQSLARCLKSIFQGSYFEDVFQTTPQNSEDNFIWLRVLPLYVSDRMVPSHRAIIMSDMTLHYGQIKNQKNSAPPLEKISPTKNEVLKPLSHESNKKYEQIQTQKIQAIGQLAGGIAHDFNNLLTAMIGFCDLLLQRVLPSDESYTDILQIKQNANRAATLVKQLLAFSRQQPLQLKTIDMKKLITGISALLRRLLGTQIVFQVSCKKNIWPITADISQLEQVIMNLAVNARDAMNGKGILTLSVSNFHTETSLSTLEDNLIPGDYVLIQISDTGCGIKKEDLPSIFEPFFSTKELGTGLGLATVYGIIKQIGGIIDVDSQIDQGTTFRIYLPKSNETVSVENPKQQLITPTTGTETVLLVEDEDAVRLFARRALQDKGYNVLCASNGEEALSLIQQKNLPDVIITDMSMPKMDGPALQQALKNYHIPMIFMSGYAEESFRNSLSQDQSIHFLPKPFTIRELALKVREVLQTKFHNS